MEKPVASFLLEYISESARDDVESWQTLKSDVTSWAEEEGRKFSDEEFGLALEVLVREGKVRAFELSANQFRPIGASELVRSQLESYWFRTKRDVA